MAAKNDNESDSVEETKLRELMVKVVTDGKGTDSLLSNVIPVVLVAMESVSKIVNDTMFTSSTPEQNRAMSTSPDENLAPSTSESERVMTESGRTQGIKRSAKRNVPEPAVTQGLPISKTVSTKRSPSLRNVSSSGVLSSPTQTKSTPQSKTQEPPRTKKQSHTTTDATPATVRKSTRPAKRRKLM